MPVKISDIREHLALRTATLTKLPITINNQPAYCVDYADGTWKRFTVSGLKEAFSFGLL